MRLGISIITVLALIAVTVSTQAASISQTENFSGIPTLSQTLTFDEFDDLGGTLTLQSIQVSVSLNTSGGQLIVDNDGEQPATGMFEFGAKGDISSTDVALLNASFQPVTAELEALHSGGFSLAANVGDGTGDYDPTGPDGMQYNGGTENDSDSGNIVSTVFSQYIGTGTYDIDIDVNQWQDFGGVSGIEWAVSPVSASGGVTVIYNYSGIPEPTSLAMLLGLGVVGLLAYARHRRA